MRTVFRLIVLVYVVACLFVGVRASRWVGLVLPGIVPSVAFWVAYVSLHLSAIGGRLLKAPWQTWMSRLLTYVGNLWLGCFLVLFACVLAGDLLRLLGRLFGLPLPSLEWGGAAVLGLVVLLSLGGYWQAHRIRLTPYEINIQKPCAGREQLTVALISDIHLGRVIGREWVEQLVERVNALDVDLVLIAGDLFNNDSSALREFEETAALFASLQTELGVYACLGNHDVDLSPDFRRAEGDRMERFYQLANITLLRDEVVDLGGITLAGRLDYMPIGTAWGRLSVEELLCDVDRSRPILLMDHQPADIRAEAAFGVDLTLCGHCHGGQIFPGSLVTAQLFVNDYGHMEAAPGAHSIVSSGVGFWGPPMRIGSRSEIVHITVHFG